MELHFFQRLFDDSLDIFSINFALLEETDALLHHRVPHADHVLGQVLDQWQKATFGVKPSVSAQFFVVRFQGFDDPWNAEFVVAFGAVQGPDDKVDNAEVKDFFVRILVSQLKKKKTENDFSGHDRDIKISLLKLQLEWFNVLIFGAKIQT